MSTREMFKRDVDIMPDDVFGIMQAIWTTFMKKAHDDYYYAMPNAETIVACGETDFVEADSFDEMIALARKAADD
jgi:hypothetical protein